MHNSGKGFTMIEFLFVLSILAVILSAGPASCGKNMDIAREAEVKGNCHSIQIALERYSMDHSNNYPEMIYGGDKRGWSAEWKNDVPFGCRAVGCSVKEDSKGIPPVDPLLHFGYIDTYPLNPFITSKTSLTTVVTLTGGKADAGYGDPRFGYFGTTMGNCLNDPRYLWKDHGVLSGEQYMIYDWEGTRENGIAMVNPEGTANPLYTAGGFPKEHWKGGKYTVMDGAVMAHWPGQFFYRSGGDFALNKEDFKNGKFEYIWDMKYNKVTRYLLGGYGSSRTGGLDVIRLTDGDGNIANNISGSIDDFYVTHGEFCDKKGDPSFWMKLSTPEVFGGGDYETCPTFPYWTDQYKEWMYGAPDGMKDGVIITLISGPGPG